MAKFYDVSEKNMNLIDQKYQETGMHNYIDLKIRGISKQKEVIKVVKTNPQAADLGNCPDSIVCYVYEDAFDRLDDEQRSMLVEDAFANVSYDDEKDKIIVGGPQISVSIGSWKKYGKDVINAAEVAQYAIAQIEEEKKAQKELEKENKKKKN